MGLLSKHICDKLITWFPASLIFFLQNIQNTPTPKQLELESWDIGDCSSKLVQSNWITNVSHVTWRVDKGLGLANGLN